MEVGVGRPLPGASERSAVVTPPPRSMTSIQLPVTGLVQRFPTSSTAAAYPHAPAGSNPWAPWCFHANEQPSEAFEQTARPNQELPRRLVWLRARLLITVDDRPKQERCAATARTG